METVRTDTKSDEEALAAVSLPPDRAEASDSLRRDALLIGVGWLGTALAMGIADLPLRYLLKDHLGLPPHATAWFFAAGNFPIYIKPLAGILSDGVPLLGTRRKHYLLLSLLAGGALWLLLGLVPRAFESLLWTFVALNVCLTLTSTVLGGLMVDAGQRHNATGRLSAQRVGITRAVALVAGPFSGFLAARAFGLSVGLSAALHFALVPVFALFLREEPLRFRHNNRALAEVGRQARTLLHSGTLWSAAGLVFLVIISPGFGTPLFYYQTNVLRFKPQFIGNLGLVSGAFGFLGACVYGLVCRRWNLRLLLAASIVVHIVGTLLYLSYRSPALALLITAANGATGVLAILPLYDLAARATPRGSEALGYSLMMSVWNFTNALSDLLGSWLYDHFHLRFVHLVWLNAGTTALVLLAVPFLPHVLMNRRDGEASPVRA